MDSKHLHPDILKNIQDAEDAGILIIDKLPEGYAIEAETRNTTYLIRQDGTITGNPKYCPGKFTGSTFGGSMIMMGRVFKGGYLEFVPDENSRRVTSSPIQRVDVVKETD